MSEEKNWIMGLWKFSHKISTKELEEIASQWSAEDKNYIQLYIRRVSKDQMGIGFTYQIPEGKDKKAAHDEYMDKTSDFLKRSFGNDLAGWDIASTVWLIK